MSQTETVDTAGILRELTRVIESRKNANDEASYVASLLSGEPNQLLKKVVEESGEVGLAAKDSLAGGSSDATVHELADLWFHTMVLMARLDLSASDVLGELERRFGQSGLEEKASRTR